MRNNNRRLVILVASVAVAAVAIGAAFAYRQGPEAAQAEAAPLTGSPSPQTPSKTPTPVKPTPTTKPTTAPPKSTGPVKVTVDINKLSQGRAPQIPHLVGREVRGGAGSPLKIPGTGGIIAIGRLDIAALAVVMTGEDDTELLKVDGTGEVRRTPDVTSLATTADQSAAAYGSSWISNLGGTKKQGGTVYAETVGESGSVRSLKVPDAWSVQVLEYVDGKVYYRADTDDTGAWKLYSWVPGEAKPTLVKTVTSPSAVSRDGRVAASVNLINDGGSCSSMVEVASGKQFSRTCDYWVTGFTPDTVTAVGGPAYGDGYCNGVQAAVDTRTGKLIREWNGCFHQIVAEDDQHVLIVAVGKGQGEETGVERAIIRCNLATPDCELATPIAVDKATEIGT
ncbi:hypothetical protein EV652_12565 [Kribbella steppae]|uniref:Uncharacterized protein n=1 Tax=Kribbella steppae TaxID=2512223 RepID=A0A4R2GWZ5_9ACTN|nr:hypothetical protein [Kribbella steppae]TCO13904.1 hypothetical protein EV652_12565 [Kribbella steppae]